MSKQICESCGEEYNFYEGDTPSKYSMVCSDQCHKKMFGEPIPTKILMNYVRSNEVEDIYECPACNKFTKVPKGADQPICEED